MPKKVLSKALFPEPEYVGVPTDVDLGEDGTPVAAESQPCDILPDHIALSEPTPDTTQTPPVDETTIPLSTEGAQGPIVQEPVDDVMDDLRRILVPNGKRGVPTLVGFGSKISNAKRYVIIDVNDGILTEAWDIYRKKKGDDPEEFLTCVYDVLQMQVPRLYRYVVPIEL